MMVAGVVIVSGCAGIGSLAGAGAEELAVQACGTWSDSVRADYDRDVTIEVVEVAIDAAEAAAERDAEYEQLASSLADMRRAIGTRNTADFAESRATVFDECWEITDGESELREEKRELREELERFREERPEDFSSGDP